MKMLVKKCKRYLKVGMFVTTNGSEVTTIENEGGSFLIEGIIGEIQQDSFFIWQNTHCGNSGILKPSTKNFMYSWEVSFDNKENAWIEIKNLNIKPKIYGIVKFCKTNYK